MFLLCPRCLRAACEGVVKKTGFACPHCRHRWEPPDHRFSRAYYAELRELDVCLVADGGESFHLASLPTTIGRDTDFRALQNNLAVSRAHCALDFDSSAGTICIRDLGSKGGTFVNGNAVAGESAVPIRPGDRLRISGVELRLEVSLSRSTAESRQPPQPGQEAIPLGSPGRYVVLGRGNGGRVIVSRDGAGMEALAVVHHAESSDCWTLLPLRREAVRLNGEVVVEQELQPYDQVTLLGESYVFDKGGAALRPEAPGQGPALALTGLEFRAGGKVILSGLTCQIPAGRLTAIIGRSGSGKTTLVKVLSGAALPDGGELSVNDQPYAFTDYAGWAQHNLAVVPQADTVHGELTVRQCLAYAAALRVGPSVSAAEKAERVHKLLDELDLAEHQDQRVATLSGGQRKRVNVAAELVASPSLLLLDEPTTGLDYQNEQGLVVRLRKLSRQGRTVVFVTHQLATLEWVDHVIFIRDEGEGEGGRVLMEGPPAMVKSRLSLDDWSNLFDRSAQAAAETLSRPEARPGSGILGTLLARLPRSAVLTLRYLRLWLANPLTSVASLLMLPLFLGLLVRMAVSLEDRLGADQMLFGLIAAFWVGMNQSVREIVKEKDIFLREHAIRVGSLDVLLSKIAFFVALAVPQALLLSAPIKWLGIHDWSISFALDELACPWPVLIGMFWLADVMGCVIGLLISAACLFIRQKGEVVAVLLVILATLPQILFSAKVIPNGLAERPEHYRSFTLWHESGNLPELLSYFTVTRYLFLPLDAVAKEVPFLQQIFIFNLTVLGMTLAVFLVFTWLLMEAFVAYQKRWR